MYIFESPYHYVQTISSEPLNLFVNQLGTVVHHSPKGKLGMSYVSFLSGISGLSFWDLLSCFFCLVLLLFLLVIFLLMVHSPDFFSRKFKVFFVKG